MRSKQFVYNLMLFCLVVIIGISIYKILVFQTEDKEAETEYEIIKEKAKTETGKDGINFAALRKINPDIVAWIRVPGTKIDYPVVQGRDNSEYLHLTFDRKKNPSGCIFLDKGCEKDLSDDNSIFYGHHMRNGTMFAQMVNFRKKSFYGKHKEIILYLPGKKLSLKVVAAYAGQPAELPVEFKDSTEKTAFIKKIKNKSSINTGGVKGKLYTFITCSYERQNNRTYVYAVEEG